MPTFNSFNNNSNDFETKQTIVKPETNKSTLVPKVFGAMFIGLLITMIIAGGIGFLFTSLLNNAADDAAVETLVTTLLIMLAVSAIGLIVMSIVIPIVFARGKHNVIIPFSIYVVLNGIMLSTLVFAVDWLILVEAIGLTCLIFGVISLIGLLGKGRIPGLGLLIIGLFLGIFVISLVNMLLTLFGGSDGYTLNWVISFLFFALVMLVSIKDIRDIKRIADAGAQNDSNLTLYCAFMIYTDFIGIFVRIVLLLARNKK